MIQDLVKQVHPDLQCSKTFLDLMMKIMTGLMTGMDDLPSANELVAWAVKEASGDSRKVIDMILYEIIEMTGHVAHDNQKKRIMPMALLIAIHNDTDIHSLVHKYVADYIPSLAELKALGGTRWARQFMGDTSMTGRKVDVYDRYEAWRTSRT